ncbi:MAG: crotonase/enoyl-CoA hydratase family protein [Deltaproteobacteria bacterium]|nr:crotonase/enoyl-CoA hydratase family protein [Deltaproteobacteria bacterium]
MSDLVKISIENHVADVRLNRPEKYNALSREMFEAIGKAIDTLSENQTIRAIVLSGEGRGFCAGLDFERFGEMETGTIEASVDIMDRLEGHITNAGQYIAYGWKQLPVPVIAAVHGVAFGGGCQIALGADIRLATPDAKLSIMEMKWGLIPDMSGSQTLRNLVRMDIAKELIFTGKIVSGEAAVGLGLITRVCQDPLAEALELAREIAGKNPHAVRAAKRLINEAWHGDEAKGFLLESELEKTLISSPNQIEAVKANFENRAPRFKDPV